MPSTHQLKSIYSPGGGMGMTRLPLQIHTPQGQIWNITCLFFPAGTRIHRALLPSDASSAATPRVLRVEAPRRTSNDPVRAAGEPTEPLSRRVFRSALRPKPTNRSPVGFVAKPTNPTRKLRLLAATLHWLHLDCSCCSCTMRIALDPVWPPGPSNQAYLSLHSSEAAMAKTFRTCSSPAPTLIKPHPAHTNTKPRVSPHHVVNHSSLRSDHPLVLEPPGSQSPP